MKLERANGQVFSIDQWNRLVQVIHSCYKDVVVAERNDGDTYNEFSFTKLSFAVGKACNAEFGGKWSCICGEYNDPRLNEQTQSSSENEGTAPKKKKVLEFSFSVSAVRFQSIIIDDRFFVYVGQIYDPVAPIRQLAQVSETSQWNLN
mgnify:CR=1 FL=1